MRDDKEGSVVVDCRKLRYCVTRSKLLTVFNGASTASSAHVCFSNYATRSQNNHAYNNEIMKL